MWSSARLTACCSPRRVIRPPAWTRPPGNWSDEVDGARVDEPRRGPGQRSRPARWVALGDYKPLAQLPERILSLVLRGVVILFILFALVTIAESV